MLTKLVELFLKAPALVRFVQGLPWVGTAINRLVINQLVSSTKPRPHPFSLWSPDPKVVSTYVAWPSLVDRAYTGRHLPPASEEYIRALPSPQDAVKLFKRNEFIACHSTSALFCFFAQWFTDSFLRTDPSDPRKNTSNHEIDLCQVYGLSSATTDLLRLRKEGQLITRSLKGKAEWLPTLYTASKLDPRFANLPYAPGLEKVLDQIYPLALKAGRKEYLYATGLERGNSTIAYTAISTVFVRIHNKIARALTNRYGKDKWDDDRAFEIARNINITLLLRIIVEEYINQLSGTDFKLVLDREFAERQRWYRTNRIAIEFNLLYRWHSLVPDRVNIGGSDRSPDEVRFNNSLMEQLGPGQVIKDLSTQAAGRIGVHNTPDFLIPADQRSLEMARLSRLRSFNDYRERFSMARYKSFEELVGPNKALIDEVKALYGDVDKVELVTGLLIEQRARERILPTLMATMVGVDAFSQALTNPLLSSNIFGEDTFSAAGLELLEQKPTFNELVHAAHDWDPNVGASFAHNSVIPAPRRNLALLSLVEA